MLRAEVLPGEGMTLRSLRLGDIEAICQSRAGQFASCRKGFGPLIGPHFNQRKHLPAAALANMARWPQTAPLAQTGVRDPWQHGAARYAPWEYTSSPNSISALLTGKREMFGQPLSAIQGGDFELRLAMRIDGNALRIHYTAEADFPPVIGLHYYYDLPGDQGRVRAPVKDAMHVGRSPASIPPDWLDASGRSLDLSLERKLDNVFPLRPGPIELATPTHVVKTMPESGVKSLVVFRPGFDGWVCVEPLSAANLSQPTGRRAEMSLTIMLESV